MAEFNGLSAFTYKYQEIDTSSKFLVFLQDCGFLEVERICATFYNTQNIKNVVDLMWTHKHIFQNLKSAISLWIDKQ